MKTKNYSLILPLSALFATGCLPEKRIVWSPDGSRAAVMGDDGLRIATPDGKLSDLLIPNARRAAWFADGRRVFVIVADKRGKWAEVEPALSVTDRARILELGQSLRAQILAHQGPIDQFEPKTATPAMPGQVVAGAMYARDVSPEGLAEKLGARWSDFEKLEVEVSRALVYSIEGDRAVESAVIATGVDDMKEPSVSPSARHVAYIRPTPKHDPSVSLDPNDLVIWSTDGAASAPAIIAHVAYGYGWRADGKSLAVIHTPTPSSKSVTIGAVATVELFAEDDTPIKPSEVKPEDRVGVFFNQFGCVKYHPDGRLIFSAHAATLPATDQEMPRSWSLYAWSSNMRAGSTRLLGRGADAILTDEQSMFEISPDGKRAVMYGAKGDIVVADLTTGETSIWFDTKEAGGTLSRPSWRNNEEVCAVTPDDLTREKPEKWSVVLLKGEGAAQSLSAGWSEAARAWLEPKPEPTTQPTSGK